MALAGLGVPSDDGCVPRRRHVPGWREVRQRVRRPEYPSYEFRGEKAGISSAHVGDFGLHRVLGQPNPCVSPSTRSGVWTAILGRPLLDLAARRAEGVKLL